MNREKMELETVRFLKILFSLKEVEKVEIKEHVIASPEDTENIRKAVSDSYHDHLSDVDMKIWVKLNPVDFSMKTPVYKAYFPRLQISDEIFGIIFQERDPAENREGLRICMKSGFRMDLSFYLQCDENADRLPEGDWWEREHGRENDACEGVHENAVKRNGNVCLAQEKADSFWFIAVQALTKLLRRDYLIADHLSHMLLMEGLVLQMEERDKKYGTNFHRYGYAEELAYRTVSLAGYEKYLQGGDENYRYIAANLIRAAVSYDRLASEADNHYVIRKENFFEIWAAAIHRIETVEIVGDLE
ncbi:MAG: hypothetical protein Q4C91_03730 [Eubacteriales bacterium]|nr:hypothetical protein [Eubacteriales bacterium]